MKQTLTFLTAILALLGLRAQNDCATALAITIGTYTVDVVDGNEVPLPVCASGGNSAAHGEWYSYTPTEDISLTVSTSLPANTGVDTRVHVYEGTCGSLSCIGGDDDSGTGYLSVATVQVSAGVTYYIAFDDRWTANGFDFVLMENTPIEYPIQFTTETITSSTYNNCIVDMDGDYLDDIVGVSSTQIKVNSQLSVGGFHEFDITTTVADHTPSWSLAAGDLDNNGKTDLLYAGGGGVTFMMANGSGTAFNEVSMPQYVFCQRSNMADIDNDGILDGFSCHDVAPNVYYISNGIGGFTYHQGGLGDTPDGGNYGSVWIDFDNDHDLDMFIAKCRGGDSPANINQMHRNNGDGTFTEMASEINLASNVQTWSSAWADYDNDGDMDVLVGASSTANGGHMLMRNDGNTFTNVTAGSGYDIFTSTGIEHAPGDFNNDGYVDVFGAGSTIMLNNGDMTFTPAPVACSSGPMGDLNDDGFLDVQNGSTLYMNVGNDNNYLKVHTVGTASNINGIGARIEVYSPMGQQIRDVRSGEGFRYMSSLNAHFGLGQDTEVEMVVVYWPSGVVDYVMNPAINELLVIVEGSSPLSLDELEETSFNIYPVPAVEILFIQDQKDNSPVRVFDMNGNVVLSTLLQQGAIDVSNLAKGGYILELRTANRKLGHKRFVKQ